MNHCGLNTGEVHGIHLGALSQKDNVELLKNLMLNNIRGILNCFRDYQIHIRILNHILDLV